MYQLHPITADQLPQFMAMEQAEHASPFINLGTLEQHQQMLAQPGCHYLGIYHQQQAVGFIILQQQADGDVEFRRIVVANPGQGIGRAAMSQMLQFCRQQLNAERVWLDVFADNHLGINLYHKLGFEQFDRQQLQGRTLLLMERRLD